MSENKRWSFARIATYVLSFIAVSVVIANLSGLIGLRIVQTSSMSGTIEVGDLIISENWAKPKVGDIALYQGRDLEGNPAEKIVHRVIAGDATNGYTFQGDNNQSADGQVVPAKDVIGVVNFWVPGVGLFAKPLLLVIVLALCSTLYFGREYIKAGYHKVSHWVSGGKPIVRRSLKGLLGVTTVWLLFALVSALGWLRIEHPQTGPNLPIGTATNSIVFVFPNMNESVGGLAMAEIAGKRSLVRVEEIKGSTLKINSTYGHLLVSRDALDGPAELIIPFVGALWIPFD